MTNYALIRVIINESDLLQGSTALNGSFSFYQEHKLLIWNVAAVLVLLSLIIALARNVMRRKRAEEALREEKAFTETALNSQRDTFFVFDLSSGSAVRWNRAFTEISGYSDAEIASMKAPDAWYSPEDLARAAAATARIQQEGQATVEMSLRTRDGSTIPFEYVASFVKSDKGDPLYIIAIGRDITERKRAEEELMRYRDHLEELVQERTRALEQTQAELLRRERLAALGRLTATVAHEIRNPLGTVRTAVFAIGEAMERNQMGRVEPALQLAERNVVRCDNIINELLDYSHDRVLQLHSTHIDTWLGALLDEQAIPQDIVCVRKLTSDLKVPIDREHLRRAVVNVVENAVQAMQEQASQDHCLTVCTRIVGDGSRLEIEFRDTGPGIPDDVLPRVFEPLFSTKSLGGGLGLSVVKNIMEQHGGGISLRSVAADGEQPGGTSVVLWLLFDSQGNNSTRGD
jgi:PAS domain S-box-containing protein